MLHRVHVTDEEPYKWRVEPYADVDGTELFIYRISMGIPKLLDASTIYPPQRDDAKHAIIQLLIEGFMPAFNHLQKIRTLVRPLEMDRRQAYTDFMGTLWRGYKNFLPKATRSIGFEMGFLFQRDFHFEKGLKSFLEANSAVPKDLAIYLRKERNGWQEKLKHVRNEYVEHTNVEWEDIQELCSIEHAEKFFESAWIAAETILACLLCTKLPPQFGVVEVPVSKRNPNFPDRFQFVLRQPRMFAKPFMKQSPL